MKIVYKDARCTLIKFDEKPFDLRKQGWLGDEAEARIFKADLGAVEIRIFKDNGESYVLNPDSKDIMVRMKASKLLEFAEKAE